MKIALVSPYDFAFPGGVGRHIINLERQFTTKGHEVKIIAPAQKRTARELGDNFIRIGSPFAVPASESIMRISLSLHLAPKIKDVMEREKFDVIHLHEPFMPMLCSATLRFSDSVNVGTFHAAQGSPGYDFGKPVSSWILHRRARKLNGHIAVSIPAMRYASRYVPAEYEIIPNGIDTHYFRPDVKPIEQYQDGKLNIVFMGRLEYRKGLNYLLKAFLEIKKQMPETRLIICGPGIRLRKRYEDWVKKNKLSDVIFTGLVSHEDQPRYYRTADIFCAPNTGHESFGLILLEAMATARPIVATSIEGFAAVVTQGEEGLLVPAETVKPLADALLSLLNDKARREQMGQKGLITARKYDWEGVASRVLAYYEKTMKEARNNGN
ncbi:MAG TPA: glycosyltransferase family 4 protein [Dehalococcoidales bacterium]|nr:glycosyltransferase family 4 protein [Dehalococcoidales bacterium]